MLKQPVLAWAIVDEMTEKLVVVDGRTPIYWQRRVAQTAAQEHGFTMIGRKPDVRLCRVQIRQFSGKVA